MKTNFPLLGRLVPVLLCAGAMTVSLTASADKNKPSLSLKATPQMGFAPARVVLTAELKGGANDYEDFYCASIEWDWGDGTKSVNQVDCDPFQAGKSEIERRHVVTHVFELPGDFNVEFRLKQKDKVVGIARTSVRIRAGVRDIGDGGIGSSGELPR
jgi:hypothetical protein